jgi:hypothetical protein
VPQVYIATPQNGQPAGGGGTFFVFGSVQPATANVSAIWVIRTDTGQPVGSITPISPPPIPYNFAYTVTGVPTNVPLQLTVQATDGSGSAQTQVNFVCPP